jgi:hypothetical protein
MRFYSMCLYTILLTPIVARADDQLYGSDTLPAMTRRAAYVVQTSSVAKDSAPKPISASFVLQSVSIEKIVYLNSRSREKFRPLEDHALEGSFELREGSKILVAIAASTFDELKATQFTSALLFISPITNGPFRQTLVSPGETRPAFMLVGGENGLVSPANKSRYIAAETFLASLKKRGMDRDVALLAWATEYSKQQDRFVWRSALFEARELAANQKVDNAAAKFLAEVLSSGEDASKRMLSVELLGSLQSKYAREPLADFARKRSELPDLREAAVEAFGRLPDSLETLDTWARQGDPVLAAAARRVAERQRRPQAAPLDENGDAEASVKRLKVICDQSGAKLSDRLNAIRDVAKHHTTDAVKTLGEVARDKTQAPLVRSTAIIEIAQMRTADSREMLFRLAKELEQSPELGNLAAGLIERDLK